MVYFFFKQLICGSPTKNSGGNSSLKASPSKMGLPDASGLIVGVNTINYDASSSVRNKAKSREERKMEMIMKAIEAMEKAEQRKKDTSGDEKPEKGPGNKRRRSSSSYRNDSTLEASSADEAMKPEPKRNRKKGRIGKGPGTPQRRRSRVKSGDSASNISADETPMDIVGTASAVSDRGPFRYVFEFRLDDNVRLLVQFCNVQFDYV